MTSNEQLEKSSKAKFRTMVVDLILFIDLWSELWSHGVEEMLSEKILN